MGNVMKQNESPFNPGYYNSSELRSMGFGKVGENVSIGKNCVIIGLGNIYLGNNVRIDGMTVIAANSGRLDIGDYVHVGGGCHLVCAGSIILEDFCGLSQGVCVYSATDDYTGTTLTNPMVPKDFTNVTSAPVTFRRHVIVGSGSVVLPGVEVAEGSSVGALSLVTKSLRSWGVYAGTPVRRLHDRSKALLELERQLLALSAFKRC